MRSEQGYGGIFLSAVLIFLAAPAGADVGVGSTREEVIAAFGEPNGQMISGPEEFLTYPQAIVRLKNNSVEKIDRLSPPAPQPLQPAAGAERPRGWQLRPEPQKTAAAAGQAAGEKVKTYAQQGKTIELDTVLVSGKITVVDFYADWCGPCRSLGPYLEKLAADNPDVYLRKIDIVNWHSPVVKQFNISSVPNVRVFNRSGKLVGEPTHDYNKILKYVQRAQ
ncbi:MAG: thioredoxin family protein [Candidatus Omnitrophica bacterium]|nr:thioredoxin family protein [Candidatus Omnitrophota bacterium]